MSAGIIGGLLSLFGTASQNANIRESIEAQKDENKKNREYNLMLARLQNQWNLEQWNRENEYNSPSAMMLRLKSAGLNPDLMYSGSQTQGLRSASSPGMTSGASSSPVDMSNLANRKTLLDVVNSSAVAAQADLFRAQAERTRAETTGQEQSNYWQNVLNRQSIQLSNSTIDLNGSTASLNAKQKELIDSNISKVSEELKNLSTYRDLVRAQIGNLSADSALKKIEAVLKPAATRAAIKQLSASANLSNQEAARLLLLKTAEFTGVNLDNALKQQSIRISEKAGLKIDAETDNLRIEASKKSDVLNSEIVRNFSVAFNMVVGALTDVTDNAAKAASIAAGL